ncbi:hypothetical protein QVO10_16645 [Bacteroides gallinaceum]|uniref:Replication initiation protein n=1 Tax=Bacteroides gallinaceum TaxID=1462571 RepID=A0ABT7XA63_9BACE|nr:hypothetical protein [Bacteroides gallinaceum]MDN0050975.1 hypothetical protein [Bacteroides gallinaceum]
MIDNVKIKLSRFNKDLAGNPNLEFHGKSYSSEVYRLYNHEGKEKGIYLLLKYNPQKQVLKIENSIRKWFLGGFSLLDLTKKTANKAFEKIAKILGITEEEFCKATFTQCEIGLNIRTRIPVENIVPMVVRYSTFKRYQFDYGTVGFNGEDLSLIMYDKCDELLEHNKKYDKSAKRKAFNALSKRNYNFFRIEFNMFDKQSFINKDLSHIKTIGDILENYLELYSFWTKEISRIVLLNKLVLSKEMTPKQYIIARVLEIDGFTSFERNCLKRAKPNISSRIINEAIEVIHSFSNPIRYNTNKFKLDILKNLKRINNKEKELDIKRLSGNLFYSEDNIN